MARLRRRFAWLARLSPALAARVFLDRFAHPGARRVLDAEDRPLLARASRHRLRVADDEVEVYEWGPPAGPAPTVLVLHGWSSHAPRFSAFVEPMLARGWRVVAFDAPGHGRSAGDTSSLMRFRRALDAVVARFGPVQGYLAHSLGALAVVLRLGDPAVTGPTRAAVLVSLPRDAGFLLDLYLDVLEAPPRVRERVRAGFARRYGIPLATLDARRGAGLITCPVLLIHDEDDESVPAAHSRELHALLPRGTLRISHGLGHNRLLRDPATVDAAVAFLARHLEPA